MPLSTLRLALCVCALIAAGPTVASDTAAPLSALAQLPVKEITVFKDGTAFVVHEGQMPTDAAGSVAMDYLPTPILGTFWPYSVDPHVKLASVTASQRRVLVERTALTLKDLLSANPGAQIGILQRDRPGYAAQIVGVPERSGQELEANAPPNSGEMLPEKADIILLKTVDGTAVVSFDSIRDATFNGAFRRTESDEEFRNLLTLKLDWPGGHPARTAHVGMMYAQKGVRWIPEYKLTLDGKGAARIELQATLINELTDLDDVTANLVIGVPTFAFESTPDPISMQNTFAQLSPYFSADSSTNVALSNAIMTQGYFGGGGLGGAGAPMGAPGPPGPVQPSPEIAGSTRTEDLFVFTVRHITLKKGQRMVLPISETSLPYKDIYTVDLPFTPPLDIPSNMGMAGQMELIRSLSMPVAIHNLRLSDRGKEPITTAPALVLSEGRVLAQGMTTYTAPGADSDLPLTADPNIKVQRTDREVRRSPNAETWHDMQFDRIDLAGTVSVRNSGPRPAEIEITREVLGEIDGADHGGKAAMIGAYEEGSASQAAYPSWWSLYNWPNWWGHFNGHGRIKWTVHLEPGQSIDLGYTWHYFWR